MCARVIEREKKEEREREREWMANANGPQRWNVNFFSFLSLSLKILKIWNWLKRSDGPFYENFFLPSLSQHLRDFSILLKWFKGIKNSLDRPENILPCNSLSHEKILPMKAGSDEIIGAKLHRRRFCIRINYLCTSKNISFENVEELPSISRNRSLFRNS